MAIMATNENGITPQMETTSSFALAHLPSVDDATALIEWMSSIRPALRKFVTEHLDPKRHMYSWEGNKHNKLNDDALAAMLKAGKRPSLNQDGLQMLFAFFGCYVEDYDIAETFDDDGHYNCRVTVRLISHRKGVPIATGSGVSSTHEPRYAYRWVSPKQLPPGVDKATLKTRAGQGESNAYTQYRLEAEDIVTVRNTVLHMASKRAQSAASRTLPMVSEMFEVLGDPEEDESEPTPEESAHATAYNHVYTWYMDLPKEARQRALNALFRRAILPSAVKGMPTQELINAVRDLAIAQKAHVDWASQGMETDLRNALAEKAKDNITELYGEQPESREGQR